MKLSLKLFTPDATVSNTSMCSSTCIFNAIFYLTFDTLIIYIIRDTDDYFQCTVLSDVL